MNPFGIDLFNSFDDLDDNNESQYFIKKNLTLYNSDSLGINPLKSKESFNCGLLSISNTNSNKSKLSEKSENILYFIENAQTKEISNNNNQINEEPKNTNHGNGEIVVEVNNNSDEVKFTSKKKKKGRPNKGQENQGNKIHTSKSNDNARKKIINSCKLSIYNLITQYVPNQLDIKLHIPTIEKQMGYSYESINKFFNKNIYKIFCDTIPKKLKNEIKNNREQYQHNKNIIDMLLENELKDENKQIKILNGLFNLCFKDFLIAYLKDETEIKISDDINISLKGFKTFSSCFNERKDGYNQSQKNVYKKNILEMIYNSKRNRKAKK
jgi:hypothetical protein